MLKSESEQDLHAAWWAAARGFARWTGRRREAQEAARRELALDLVVLAQVAARAAEELLRPQGTAEVQGSGGAPAPVSSPRRNNSTTGGPQDPPVVER